MVDVIGRPPADSATRLAYADGSSCPWCGYAYTRHARDCANPEWRPWHSADGRLVVAYARERCIARGFCSCVEWWDCREPADFESVERKSPPIAPEPSLWQRWFVLLIALSLGACLDEPRAHVRVEVAVDAPELAEYVDGANAWSQLGYLASFDATGLPECDDVREAFDGSCEVVVYVGRGHIVERFGAAGVTARDDQGRRVSLLDVRYSGLELVALAAHELGHSLLDTHEHVADPRAVMFHASSNWTPQPDDYALACSSIGVCR